MFFVELTFFQNHTSAGKINPLLRINDNSKRLPNSSRNNLCNSSIKRSPNPIREATYEQNQRISDMICEHKVWEIPFSWHRMVFTDVLLDWKFNHRRSFFLVLTEWSEKEDYRFTLELKSIYKWKSRQRELTLKYKNTSNLSFQKHVGLAVL